LRDSSGNSNLVADIIFRDGFLIPNSIHGVLWLQTHFEDDYWDVILSGDVHLDNISLSELREDAELAGLDVQG
jgi:hypothetical protein